MLRLVVGALLLVLAFAGGYAVAACKTVTLTVDGTAMRVTTMKSRVIDIVEENGFSVDDRDDLYPAAGVQVHDADTIVLRRSRPLQISLDGHDAKQVWTTASTVDEALAQLAMTDTAPAAASRQPRPAVRDGATGRQRQDGAAQRRRVGAHGALAGPQCRGAAECGRRAAVAKRPRGARRDGPDRRRHADPGDPQSDQEGHRAAAAAAERASCRGPGDEHEPGGRRRPGVPGTQDVTFAVAEVNGVETGRLPVANVVVTPAHEAVVRVGTKPGTEVPR